MSLCELIKTKLSKNQSNLFTVHHNILQLYVFLKLLSPVLDYKQSLTNAIENMMFELTKPNLPNSHSNFKAATK